MPTPQADGATSYQLNRQAVTERVSFHRTQPRSTVGRNAIQATGIREVSRHPGDHRRLGVTWAKTAAAIVLLVLAPGDRCTLSGFHSFWLMLCVMLVRREKGVDGPFGRVRC